MLKSNQKREEREDQRTNKKKRLTTNKSNQPLNENVEEGQKKSSPTTRKGITFKNN